MDHTNFSFRGHILSTDGIRKAWQCTSLSTFYWPGFIYWGVLKEHSLPDFPSSWDDPVQLTDIKTQELTLTFFAVATRFCLLLSTERLHVLWGNFVRNIIHWVTLFVWFIFFSWIMLLLTVGFYFQDNEIDLKLLTKSLSPMEDLIEVIFLAPLVHLF